MIRHTGKSSYTHTPQSLDIQDFSSLLVRLLGRCTESYREVSFPFIFPFSGFCLSSYGGTTSDFFQ